MWHFSSTFFSQHDTFDVDLILRNKGDTSAQKGDKSMLKLSSDGNMTFVKLKYVVPTLTIVQKIMDTHFFFLQNIIENILLKVKEFRPFITNLNSPTTKFGLSLLHTCTKIERKCELFFLLITYMYM